MSAVNITNVAVLDNPAPFLSPFQFEISYECLDALKDDLEWKLTYVGSAEDDTYDQQLESVFVGPVNVGKYRFVLQADPLNHPKFVKKILLVSQIQRNILVDKPRVTKFPINFHPENNEDGEQAPPPDNATEEKVLGEEPVSSPKQCNEQCPQT
ncbi:hypothetical protein H5410_025439 [Solanum commersonii]|uniref:Uncharacterized protein n=1 Tax=Solanum commersonii TaxID=4109 RepID=A0A9J5YT44_SOLCO|nr:hypothetical protein H5410_025439 [Solanum commersonii]